MAINAAHASPPALPARPKLRPIEPCWIRYQGESRLLLRDPLQLTDATALIPRALVPLLAALDGTRDFASISEAFIAQTGVSLPEDVVRTLITQLDEALLLESPRAAAAKQARIDAYRAQPHRTPALAQRSYPAAPEALDAHLEAFAAQVDSVSAEERLAQSSSLAPRLTLPATPPMAPVKQSSGVLSPHIDYTRGGPVYAATWRNALPAVATAEVVVIFGTDHHGSAARLTPTPQRYATPWGAVETDVAAVDAVARALGEPVAYDEELHHLSEHSIELALVWLHWALRRAGVTPPPVVPVLCGSFHCYTRAEDLDEPEQHAENEAALEALATAIGGRRALVVSAADLAHVGPAFGDETPLGLRQKQALAQADAALLEHVCAGDAAAFLGALAQEQDRRKVCGLPPTYWAMRLLERLRGERVRGRVSGYDVCPADPGAGSVVSIGGVLWE